MEGNLLTVKQMVELSGFKAETIRRALKRGDLKGFVKNGQWRAQKSDVEIWLTGKPLETSELTEIEAKTNLVNAKRDLLLAEQGFAGLEEFIKARDNFEPAQQELDRDIQAYRQRVEEFDAEKQRAERIIKSWKELVAIAKALMVIRAWCQERVVMVDAYVEEAGVSHEIKGSYFKSDHPFPKLPKCPQELWEIFNVKDGSPVTTPLLGDSMFNEESEEEEDESSDNQ